MIQQCTLIQCSTSLFKVIVMQSHLRCSKKVLLSLLTRISQLCLPFVFCCWFGFFESLFFQIQNFPKALIQTIQSNFQLRDDCRCKLRQHQNCENERYLFESVIYLFSFVFTFERVFANKRVAWRNTDGKLKNVWANHVLVILSLLRL